MLKARQRQNRKYGDARNPVGNKTAGGSRSKFTREAEKGFSRLGKANVVMPRSIDPSELMQR